jgi:predicted aldo/keto reductase-like oxidoreductase
LVALAGKVLSGVAVATMIRPMSDGWSPAAASACFAASAPSVAVVSSGSAI